VAFEVANALAAGIRRGRLDAVAADVFLRRLEGLNIQVEVRDQPISGRDLLPLALRHGLTAYDAAYLELAMRKGYALATLDRHLIAAAPHEGVQLMGRMS
jgi:predicted nucleic acid-binding protein